MAKTEPGRRQSRRTPGAALLLALALPAGACSMYRNPSYCEQSSECDDGLMCDMTTHKCVVTETRQRCDGPSDCTDPSASLCVEGFCGQCASGADCSANSPRCSGAPEHVCTGCGGPDDCAAFEGTGICASDGRCVGCASELDCTPGQACDPDERVCRSCTANAQCESLVCRIAEGTCAAPAEVVHVSREGLDQPGCSRESPCATLAYGLNQLATGRPYLQLAAGQYAENLDIDTTVIVVAEVGAELRGSQPDSPVLLLSGGTVTIEGLTVVGRSTSTSDGIQATGGQHVLRGMSIRDHGGNGLAVSGTAEVSVLDASVSGNGRSGVAVVGGHVVIERSALAGNVDFGCSATGGEAELRATTIAENRAGGLFGRDARMDVVNCFIHHNTSTDFAPVHFSTSSVSRTARVVHTTIAANVSGDDSTSGVRCGGAYEVLLRNDIIHSNDGPGATVAGCTITHSLLGPTVEPGLGNVLGAPRFVDLEAGDLHLVPTSTGVDDGTSGDADVDADGDSRPLGLAPDMGADEVPAS